MLRKSRLQLIKTLAHIVKHDPGYEGYALGQHLRISSPKSYNRKVQERANAGMSRKWPPSNLVVVRQGTRYFDQDDCRYVAPKQFQAVATSMCSSVDRTWIKEASGFQKRSHIVHTTGDTRVMDNNEIENLFSETIEIGLCRKWNYEFHCEVGWNNLTSTVFTPSTGTGAKPKLIRAELSAL